MKIVRKMWRALRRAIKAAPARGERTDARTVVFDGRPPRRHGRGGR